MFEERKLEEENKKEKILNKLQEFSDHSDREDKKDQTNDTNKIEHIQKNTFQSCGDFEYLKLYTLQLFRLRNIPYLSERERET